MISTSNILIYSSKFISRTKGTEGLSKIGPWGGNGGEPRDIAAVPHHLQSIEIRCEGAVDSLSFTYTAINGMSRTVGPWGGSGGKKYKVKLGHGEIVKEVSGTYSPFAGYANIIRSLTFVTNVGTHGPFGETHGTPFSVPVGGDGCVVGFFGLSSWLLDAFGIYVHP